MPMLDGTLTIVAAITAVAIAIQWRAARLKPAGVLRSE